MDTETFVLLSCALNFGVPLAIAVIELIRLRRERNGGGRRPAPHRPAPLPPSPALDGPAPLPPGPALDGPAPKPLPDCLIPRPLPRRTRELEPV